MTGRGDVDQHGVAARHEQCQVRERGRYGLQQRRQEVTFQVMDRHRRHTPGESQRPAQRGARQQGADQSGTRRVGHAMDLRRSGPGVGQGRADQGQQAPHVVARSELRYHPAIHAMQVDLAVNLVRQQAALVVVDRDRGFIAGGFEGQDAHV
jgi:hypothetical protein